MNWGSWIITTFLAAIVSGGITFFAAQFFLHRLANGDFAHWEALGAPPAPFHHFLGVVPCRFVQSEFDGKAVVFIESVDNQVYKNDLCANANTWVEAVKPATLNGFRCGPFPTEVSPPSFRRLPDAVTECWKVVWSWETVRDDSYFVALRDQTLWWWRDYVDFFFQVKLVCGVPILGAILGTWIWSRFWRAILRRQSVKGVA